MSPEGGEIREGGVLGTSSFLVKKILGAIKSPKVEAPALAMIGNGVKSYIGQGKNGQGKGSAA